MIKNGITKKNTLLHQARPAKIELAAVKHYSVKQYVLFSYLVLSDAEINENMFTRSAKSLSIMLSVMRELNWNKASSWFEILSV